MCKESEEIGERRGVFSAIGLGLELKFGTEGLELMKAISQIEDLDKLRTIRNVIRSAQSLDELRQLI